MEANKTENRFKQLVGSLRESAKKIQELDAAEKSKFENGLLNWTAPSFVRYQRNRAWYITAAILVFLLVLAAVWTGSPTFAIAILTFAVVYIVVNQDDPKQIQVGISTAGIRFGSRVYPYNQIKTFWIEYDPPYYQSLHVVLKNKMKEEITINFHGINPSLIREVLTKYLPEWEEREKTFTENITRTLGL